VSKEGFVSEAKMTLRKLDVRPGTPNSLGVDGHKNSGINGLRQLMKIGMGRMVYAG